MKYNLGSKLQFNVFTYNIVDGVLLAAAKVKLWITLSFFFRKLASMNELACWIIWYLCLILAAFYIDILLVPRFSFVFQRNYIFVDIWKKYWMQVSCYPDLNLNLASCVPISWKFKIIAPRTLCNWKPLSIKPPLPFSIQEVFFSFWRFRK